MDARLTRLDYLIAEAHRIEVDAYDHGADEQAQYEAYLIAGFEDLRHVVEAHPLGLWET